MSTQSSVTQQEPNAQPKSLFFILMAIITGTIAIVSFAPSLIDTSARRGPVTFALAAHGALFFAWLLLFFTQALLINQNRWQLHRQLGYAALVIAILMVISGYQTAITMAQRGYDLSGDVIKGPIKPLENLIFPLGDLLNFSLLVGVALALRRRKPEVHKRLMLFAVVGALMPAPLAHFIGHSASLSAMAFPVIVIPLFLLLFSPAVYEKIARGRIHPVSIWVPLAMFIWANIRAAAIAPSEAWHSFALWLIQ